MSTGLLSMTTLPLACSHKILLINRVKHSVPTHLDQPNPKIPEVHLPTTYSSQISLHHPPTDNIADIQGWYAKGRSVSHDP